MRTAITVVAVFAAALFFCGLSEARTPSKGSDADNKRISEISPVPRGADFSGRASRAAARQGTTFLASYTFDLGPNCVAEGWTTADITAQTGIYVHVDDFAGLGGGSYGGLVALEGNQSMWCGARPDPGNLDLCGYGTLPGYGNAWNQGLITDACLSVTTGVLVDYLIAWNSEPDYDATSVEIDQCDDNWMAVDGGLGVFDGTGGGFRSTVIADSLHEGSLRVRFWFRSDGAWSDQDGWWDTDGAFILDSLTVRDAAGVVLAEETFEDELPGDTEADGWTALESPGYGDYAVMYPAISMVQVDPCRSELSCVWSFFTGSTETYACGGYPSQTTVPYENSRGQYLHNEIWSPLIPWTGTGVGAELVFDVYSDLKVNALVFFVWHVRPVVDGCPLTWTDYNGVYYTVGEPGWYRIGWEFGGLMTPGATGIQVALGTIDMCGYWNGIYGDCECHSHSPLFDNVEVYRIATEGPQWTGTWSLNLFQDTFATDGTLTGTARADAADNFTGGVPNDSAVVAVGDPEAGLAGDAYTGTGPAVYCHVGVRPPNQAGKSGAAIEGDAMRFPLVDSSLVDDTMWYKFRMDSVFTQPDRNGLVADKYCIDLNDNLFTPGDTINFVFSATNAGAVTRYYSFFTGEVNSLETAVAGTDEFTILPAAGPARGGDIFYVNATGYRPQQRLVEEALQQMGIFDQVDRYDIRSGGSGVLNHPSNRVANIYQQIIPVYQKILWDTAFCTECFDDDFENNNDDTEFLLTFLENAVQPGGVYLAGDMVAGIWASYFSSPSAIGLRSQYINFNVSATAHSSLYGYSPLTTGAPGGIFSDGFGPDTLVAYGGCPYASTFDVLEELGSSGVEASYHGGGGSGTAILSQRTTNPQGTDVGFVLSGFGFYAIADDRPEGIPARSEHLHRIITWLGNIVDQPVAAGPTGYEYSLDQNRPNPFNPVTTIAFTLKENGPVTLRIYNVAGQLVHTLINEEREAGVLHEARWNGVNDAGQNVSSGVYFYRLVAGDFVQTRKMVLLK